MKILLNNNDLNEALYNVSNLGFVPTMGSLHKGHISLIKKSLRSCNKTIVSIFVNPTQFNSKKDYKSYPKNYQKDLLILNKLNIDYLFLPKISTVYDKKKTKIKLSNKDKILCAKYRKGHFEGVIDVMERLTDKIKPKKIFMGEKDYQQFYLVNNYLKKKYRTKIIPCKTIRDRNKVAFSSRNLLLKKNHLLTASKLVKDLFLFKKKIKAKKIEKKLLLDKKKDLIKSYNVDIEYFDLRKISNLKTSNRIKNSKLFISYYLNNVRLIDNF